MANETLTLQPDEGVARRSLLKCMLWAGSGVLWTIAGGIPDRSGSIPPRRRPQLPPRA